MKILFVTILAATMLIGSTSCGDKSKQEAKDSIESAGKSVNSAKDEVAGKIEEGKDKAKENIDAAGKSIEETKKDVSGKVESAKKKAKEEFDAIGNM